MDEIKEGAAKVKKIYKHITSSQETFLKFKAAKIKAKTGRSFTDDDFLVKLLNCWSLNEISEEQKKYQDDYDKQVKKAEDATGACHCQ